MVEHHHQPPSQDRHRGHRFRASKAHLSAALTNALRSSLSFRKHEGGNIAVIFAITLLPLLTTVGVAVDYSQASGAYAKLMACADAAVLSVVGTQGMTSNAAAAQTAMRNWFNAACTNTDASLYNVTVSNVTPAVTDTNGARVATLTFTASRTNTFLKVAGLPKTDISGQAKAGSAKPTYIDIYAMLDDSPSMGLASTIAGMNKLKTLTPDSCQFGCHQTGASSDNHKIARNNNVEMRIDVLRTSWINLITQAQAASGTNNFRIATYTFDDSLNTVQPLTGSFTTALSSAATIDLTPVPASGPGSSYIDNMLTLMVPNIPVAGDGSTAALSKKYMIFVTDGVQDIVAQTSTGHATAAVTPSRCDPFKTKGIQVAVIYTTYLPFNDPAGNYNLLVAPIASQIEPALQACASTGLYFKADEASDISDAFNSIFAHALAKARLTN